MVLRQIYPGQAGLPVANSTHSYWHKEPSPHLLNHRTTPALPSHTNTLIIGTGMTGAFAARFLKQESSSSSSSSSSSLVMLEAREACWGATGRNGGHCQPFLYGTSESIARFELDTYFYLRDLVEQENIPCGWRTVPGVHALLTEDVWDAAREAVPKLTRKVPDFRDKIAVVGKEGVIDDDAAAAAAGQEWSSGMSLASLRLRHPAVKGAIVQRYAASMWPYKLVCWVLEQLLATYPPEAFNLQTNTPVTRLVRKATDGSNKWVAHTPRGTITADRVLLATNGYTSHLLPEFSDLIVPVRGQIGALLPPLPTTPPPQQENHQPSRVQLDASYVFFGSLKDETSDTAATRDEYLVQRPLPNGELILGGGRNLAKKMAVGEWRDDVLEPEVAQYLRSELEPVLDVGRSTDSTGHDGKEKEELEATMEWTGIMAYSRDHVPWIGAVPAALGGGDGLFIASGFTGHGMPRCALAGRGVARMMLASEKGNEGLVEAHGIPEVFIASAERAEEARRRWGPVGTVDEMEALMADLKEI